MSGPGRAADVRAIRAAMRERQGELRDDALERLRHAMRRAASRAEKGRTGVYA